MTFRDLLEIRRRKKASNWSCNNGNVLLGKWDSRLEEQVESRPLAQEKNFPVSPVPTRDLSPFLLHSSRPGYLRLDSRGGQDQPEKKTFSLLTKQLEKSKRKKEKRIWEQESLE